MIRLVINPCRNNKFTWTMWRKGGEDRISKSAFDTFDLAEMDAMRFWREECGNQVLKLA